MFYPRTNDKGELVGANQMVSFMEHLQREHRIVAIEGVIQDETNCCNMLLALDSVSDKPIKIIINSPGGVVETTFMLYDTIKTLNSSVWTLGRSCCSAAATLLAAGQAKKRFVMPHAKVMLHLIQGGFDGDPRDAEIYKKEMDKYMKATINILQENGVKKSTKEVMKDINRDKWFSAEEAIAYGLADKIMTNADWKEWLE
jgi:ATP-dependent Clp protease protease subunit